VRIIAPQRGEIRAVYPDIHGGGFYLGSAARGDARNAHLADALGVAVVSVDYRLTPSTRGQRLPTTARRPPLGSWSRPRPYLGRPGWRSAKHRQEPPCP
jgi:hypothetical protein